MSEARAIHNPFSINNNATLTLSNVTVPAGNKALVIVMIRNSSSLTATSVDYNSQAMTLLQTSGTAAIRHHIYYRDRLERYDARYPDIVFRLLPV